MHISCILQSQPLDNSRLDLNVDEVDQKVNHDHETGQDHRGDGCLNFVQKLFARIAEKNGFFGGREERWQ